MIRYISILFLALIVVGHCQGQTNQILISTMNCYWFLTDTRVKDAKPPLTQQDYELKAGHLIGLLPKEAPLFVGLQEIGDLSDVQSLANSASKRYQQEYIPLFKKGRDTATGQNVGALFNTQLGWGIYGEPARHGDLEKSLSKHLTVVLTNQTTSMTLCVVHLRVARDDKALEAQIKQNQALLRWSMRFLSKSPDANIIILGDYNEREDVNSPNQSLATLFKAVPPFFDPMSVLTSTPATHIKYHKALDRILISNGIKEGLNHLKYSSMTIGRHTHSDSYFYTDHFPVNLFMKEIQK